MDCDLIFIDIQRNAIVAVRVTFEIPQAIFFSATGDPTQEGQFSRTSRYDLDGDISFVFTS
jgi:hypothetical protein